MRKVLEDMPEKNWNLERDQPDLLRDNGDVEMENEMGLVDHSHLGEFLSLPMPFIIFPHPFETRAS